MSKCERIQHKLFLFDEADETAKLEIEEHISTCKKCAKFSDQRNAIFLALSHQYEGPQLNDGDEVRYAIQSVRPGEADHDGREMSQTEIEKFKQVMANDAVLTTRVKRLSREFLDLENYLTAAGLPDIELAPSVQESAVMDGFIGWLRTAVKRLLETSRGFANRARPVKVGFGLAVTAVAFLTFHLTFDSDNPYQRLAMVSKSEFTFATRSSAIGPLVISINNFQKGDYLEVISKLNQPFILQQDPALQFDMRYLVGISHLLLAEQKILWVEQNFDVDRVKNAITELTLAHELASVPATKETCLWYLAKAHLMLPERPRAITTLQEIVKMRGRHFRQAKSLLAQL